MSLLAGETKYPFRLQSEQNNLTHIIRRHLETMPNVTLQFSSPVGRVEQGFEHVRISLPGTDRDHPIRARWVVAADGAQSNIRKSLGISLETTYDERFLVISTTHEFRDDFPDLAYVSYISDPEEWGVLLRTPDHWRALFPVQDDESDESTLSPTARDGSSFTANCAAAQPIRRTARFDLQGQHARSCHIRLGTHPARRRCSTRQQPARWDGDEQWHPRRLGRSRGHRCRADRHRFHSCRISLQ